MQTRELCEGFEEMVGNRRARQVVDEPANIRSLFHPEEETYDVRLGEMVGHKGTDNDVNRRVRRERKDIGVNPLDSTGWRCCFCCDGDGIRIQVTSS